MVLDKPVPPPSLFNPLVPPALDDIVLRGLQREPNLRFSTARELALAIEQQTVTVAASEVGAWVERVWGESLKERTRHLVAIESSERSTPSGSEKSTPGPESADGAIPQAESNADAETPAYALDGERNLPDRSMINTRRIVGLSSLLSVPRAPSVPKAQEGAAVVVPAPERKITVRRIGGARMWTLAGVGVVALVVLLVARSGVQRLKDSHPEMAGGAVTPSEPRRTDSPCRATRAARRPPAARSAAGGFN